MTLWTLYLLRSIVIGANIIQTAKFGKPYPQHNIDEWMIYKYEKAKYVCKNVFLKKITKYKQLKVKIKLQGVFFHSYSGIGLL